MNTHDIYKKQHILESLTENALLDTIRWLHARCSPQEPDYVAALSTIFLEEFFHVLVAVFPQYDFSVTGIYCHQKPIVDIGQKKRPELGDILFVYTDRRQSEKPLLNSLLFQAKISSDFCQKIHPRDMHQLKLYKEWPKFTYYRAGHLNGKTRDILPKTINDGAQYLLIDNNPLTNGLLYEGMFPMGCAVPDNTLFINNSLSGELVDFLKFKSGRVFESNPNSTEDDWSKMIWDLLTIAARQYSRRQNANFQSFPRMKEYRHFSTEHMRGRTLLEEALDDYAESNLACNEDQGVSLVLVESRRKEIYKEDEFFE